MDIHLIFFLLCACALISLFLNYCLKTTNGFLTQVQINSSGYFFMMGKYTKDIFGPLTTGPKPKLGLRYRLQSPNLTLRKSQ